MATAEIVEPAAPYYGVQVVFGAQSFHQLIVSSLTGVLLNAMLQAYADTYEAEWLALNPEG
jgi:hypothetical protein